jgi:hypothetical protein
MSDAEFFAKLCDVQLETDRSATFETRTVFTKGAVQHLIEELGLKFAPGLSNMIRSQNAPSVQQLRACSIPLSRVDLKSKWVVYLQYYRKGPIWYICCGKSTNIAGAHTRLDDYVKERCTMPQAVKDLLKRGYERMSHTILAAVDIPFEGADREYVTALVTAFEGTLAAGLWAYCRLTLGSVTPLRFWEEVPWSGACTHSSLMEISFTTLRDDFPNLDEIRRARTERMNLASTKYRNTEKGQVASAEYVKSLKEAYSTNEEFREHRKQYQKQYTADGKQAVVRNKHKASEKFKITEAAYRASEAAAKSRSKYARSDKNKAAQKKYAQSEKGKAAAKRKEDNYRDKKKEKYRLKKEAERQGSSH